MTLCVSLVVVCCGGRQWDRYAQFEYMKLAEEEEAGQGDGADDVMAAW